MLQKEVKKNKVPNNFRMWFQNSQSSLKCYRPNKHSKGSFRTVLRENKNAINSKLIHTFKQNFSMVPEHAQNTNLVAEQ